MVSRLLNTFFFIVGFCVCSQTATGQLAKVTGNVVDSLGSSILNANVMVVDTSGKLYTYTYTGDQGAFALKFQSDTNKELFLEVSHLSYKKYRQKLTHAMTHYNIRMTSEPIKLAEIEVKKRPYVSVKGDTLSYEVKAFEHEADRNIGDVLRHMPGIDVSASGRIYYNGQAISNLYLQGDDLMDGRYSLATRTVRKESIKSVDIIQHHQPVKVLKGKVFTNEIAMNLVLEDENSWKLSGEVMLGGGVKKKYDGAVNTVLLHDKLKMLNTIQANNNGVDYRQDFMQHGSVNTSGLHSAPYSPILSLGNAGSPDINRARYYRNKSAAINLNNLYKTPGDLQLKSNMYLFTDQDKFTYGREDIFVTPNETIQYHERQDLTRRPFRAHAALSARVNKTDYFLQNKLNLRFQREENRGLMDFNSKPLDQNHQNKLSSLLNDFKWIPSLKNGNIMEVLWHFHAYENQENLLVDGYLTDEIIASGKGILRQLVDFKNLFSQIETSYMLNNSSIKQNYALGATYERRKFSSHLKTVDDTEFSSDVGKLGNELDWKRQQVYFKPRYFMKMDDWEISLSSQFTLQSISYRDISLDNPNNQLNLLVNPNANFKWILNPDHLITANYNYKKDYGSVEDVYRGVILRNYRSLNASTTELQHWGRHSASVDYQYRQPLSLLFGYVSLHVDRGTTNVMLATSYLDDLEKTQLISYKNTHTSLNAKAGSSKYIFALNLNVALDFTWRKTRLNRLIQEEIIPFYNELYSLNGKIETKITPKIDIEGQTLIHWYIAREADRKKSDQHRQNVRRLNQTLGVNYSPSNVFFIKLSGKYMHDIQTKNLPQDYLFLDAQLRYRFDHWRMDFEIDLDNITNMKTYTRFQVTSNQFMVDNYSLRGFMATFRVRFNI